MKQTLGLLFATVLSLSLAHAQEQPGEKKIEVCDHLCGVHVRVGGAAHCGAARHGVDDLHGIAARADVVTLGLHRSGAVDVADGDGAWDGEEIAAGTDPGNPEFFPAVSK